MSSLATLPSIPTIGQANDPFYSTDSTNPASGFYVPPIGSYQNDAGQVVSNSTPSYSLPTYPSLSSLMSSSEFGSTPNAATPQTPSSYTTIPSSQSSTVYPSDDNNWFQKLLTFFESGTGSPSESDLTDIVFIVLGLLLITAGLFAFKSTQSSLSSGGKTIANAPTTIRMVKSLPSTLKAHGKDIAAAIAE